MRFKRIYPDRQGETLKLWGKAWPFILEADSAWELATHFKMGEVQVSRKNYAQGGPVVHVTPEDEREIVRRGLVRSHIPVIVPASPEQDEAARMLQRLWTKAVGTSDYDKEEWKAFQGMLMDRGVLK